MVSNKDHSNGFEVVKNASQNLFGLYDPINKTFLSMTESQLDEGISPII